MLQNELDASRFKFLTRVVPRCRVDAEHLHSSIRSVNSGVHYWAIDVGTYGDEAFFHIKMMLSLSLS